MRIILGLAAGLMLAGCMEDTGAVSRTGDGQAAKLRPGMSENDAFAIFGPESGFERNPENWDQSCISYAYGAAEAPRYVHATYQNGQLLRATDGHASICTYG